MEFAFKLLQSYTSIVAVALSLPLLLLIVRFTLWTFQPLFSRAFPSLVETESIEVRKRFHWPLSGLLWSLIVLVLEPALSLIGDENQWNAYGEDVFTSIFIAFSALFLWQVIKVIMTVVRANLDISHSDNLEARRALTQLQYIEKIVFVFLFIFATGLILLRFESLAKFGGGVLASAGLASVVIGFAAQESVSNLIAGFQIAFTQPFRLDDAVVVEGEWGWVEEIHFTYVVVRIWDKRRLVLPIKHFTTQPFQNWTRVSAQIIGAVVLHLDYQAPIHKIRQAFTQFVTESKHWDGDVQVLQVIEATEKTITLRGLLSAKDSPTTWDLRCEVRERLIDFIQRECPEALPQTRLLHDGNPEAKPEEGGPSL